MLDESAASGDDIFLLRLYRLAREIPVRHFPPLAREMLKALMADSTRVEVEQTHRPPDEALRAGRETDISPMEALLRSHAEQAIRLNALLLPCEDTIAPFAHALLSAKGALLYCGETFARWVACPTSRVGSPRLPATLLLDLLRGQRIRVAAGTVEITPVRIGTAWLLNAEAVPLCRRLTPREQSIARLFGAGQAYREIAEDMKLAPATVRNVVQRVYRKLDISSKAMLAQLLMDEQ
jgi:DNA-binding NarL/FixJ family response regulator